MRPTGLAGRIAQLFGGLVLIGAGIGFFVRSELGVAPWDVFHQGLSLRTPLSIGGATIATAFGVLFLWIPFRQRPGVGALANALTVGTAVDRTLAVVPPMTDAGAGRWLALVAGVLMFGVGSGLYIGARLGPGPRDGLMTGIAARGTSIRVARTITEACALVAGWLLGGTVGVGTVVFVVTIGPLVQFFLQRFDRGPSSDPLIARLSGLSPPPAAETPPSDHA